MFSSAGLRFSSFRIDIRVFFFSFFLTSRKVCATSWQAPPNRPMVRKTVLQILSFFSLAVGKSSREYKGIPHWLHWHVRVCHTLVHFCFEPHVHHLVGTAEDEVLQVMELVRPFSTKSNSLPGVATRMLQPFSKFCSWNQTMVPLKAIEPFEQFMNFVPYSQIWIASSLVGVIMTHWGFWFTIQPCLGEGGHVKGCDEEVATYSTMLSST